MPSSDLETILEFTAQDFHKLRGARLFISGGTGFIGRWLLESFSWANQRLDLGMTATVLTRDIDKFARTMPHLANQPCFSLHQGDIRNFNFPLGKFSHIIHGAMDACAASQVEPSTQVLDTLTAGTRRVLDFMTESGATRLLFLSSGAVYGKQPSQLQRIPETFTATERTVYGEGKSMAEQLCNAHASVHGVSCVSARCFAFVGNHLPLDGTFAAGNFLRDAHKNGIIQILGDGTPFRSYLYAADLATWLWTLLVRGESGTAYNVGSDQELSIEELAHRIARLTSPSAMIRIAKQAEPGVPAERYIPAIDRAKRELGLEVMTSLDTALHRTLESIRHRLI